MPNTARVLNSFMFWKGKKTKTSSQHVSTCPMWTRRQDASMLWNSSSSLVSSGEDHKKMKQLFAPRSINTCGQKTWKSDRLSEAVEHSHKEMLSELCIVCLGSLCIALQFLKCSNFWPRNHVVVLSRWASNQKQSLRKEPKMSCEPIHVPQMKSTELNFAAPKPREDSEAVYNGNILLNVWTHSISFNKHYIFHPFSLAACWFSLAHSCRDVDNETIVEQLKHNGSNPTFKLEWIWLVALGLSPRIFRQFCQGAGSKFNVQSIFR